MNGTATLASAGIGPRLRAMRIAKDIPQTEMAAVLKISQGALSKYESERLAVPPDVRRSIEWVLRVADDGHAMISVPYLTLEQSATSLRTWEGALIPGILQTPEYARHVLRAATPGIPASDLDQMVALREKRQEIWQREDPLPPMFAAVIGEGALRRLVGSPAIMRGQMEHLVTMTAHPRVRIQVLPFDAGGSVGLQPAFVLASFAGDGHPDAVYLDDTLVGRTTDKRETVAQVRLLFDDLAREALRLRDSADMITEVAARWN